jgi:two-component system response regulator NreC
MKILIADDHAVVREGLRQLLGDQADMDVVGTARDGQEALEKAKSLRPDVALLDIAMPHLTGLEAVRLIKDAVPEIQIVILSMYDKEAFVHEVFASGALGYVLKAAPSSDVVEAVRAANRGEYFLSSQMKAEVIQTYLESRKEKPRVRRYDGLTLREQEVFRLMVEGNSTARTADILCVSPKTVEKHRASVMRKLGIRDLLGLVKYAMKIGIIDPDVWKDWTPQ